MDTVVYTILNKTMNWKQVVKLVVIAQFSSTLTRPLVVCHNDSCTDVCLSKHVYFLVQLQKILKKLIVIWHGL